MAEKDNISNNILKFDPFHDYNEYFGKNISSIGKEKSSSISENENNILISNLKDKNHYLCKECKALHLIKMVYEEKKDNENKSSKEEKKVNEQKIYIEKIVIECNKKGKIDLDKYLVDEPIENFDNYKFCQTHKENEKIGFCLKCEKDLCEKCKEVNDCENKQSHKFMKFEEKKEEIRNKEKFISEVLEKKYIEEIKPKSEASHPQKNSGNNNFTEKIGYLDSLYHFYKALENSKDKIPSYMHYENIINIYHFLCDKLKIKYHCSSNKKTKKTKKTKIRLFGEIFIENNKNKCSVIINNELKKIEDCQFYEVKEPNKDLNIILLKDDDIIDMSYMFNECEELQFIYNDSKWEASNINNMSYMFYNCKKLTFLPKFIYDCNTSKVTDMSNMFNGCESLNGIDEISDWDTSNVESMCKMFYGCKSLEKLENILKWDTKNVTDMSYMFYNCSKLKSIDIDNKEINKIKWNTENVNNISYMFYGCESLEYLPESITSWNLSKVVYMQYMFYNCKKLTRLPDISNWNIQKVAYMNDMFGNCSSLESLPEINKWKIDSLIDMNFFIEGCTSLKLPDLSKWDRIEYKKGELTEKCFKKK